MDDSCTTFASSQAGLLLIRLGQINDRGRALAGAIAVMEHERAQLAAEAMALTDDLKALAPGAMN